jgi:hypothetical protein
MTAWYSSRSNYSSSVIPREKPFAGWEGTIRVEHPGVAGLHGKVRWTLEGVGSVTLEKGANHDFSVNDTNNGAAQRFIMHYQLIDHEWAEVPATPVATDAALADDSVALEPYGCLVFTPQKDTCSVSMTTRLESVTAVLSGVNAGSGTVAETKPQSSKYLFLNGYAPTALQGSLPSNDAQVDIEEISLAISTDSLAQSLSVAADTALEYHMHHTFPVHRGAGGFKSVSELLGRTHSGPDPANAIEYGDSLVLSYTVHKLALYETMFRAPLLDALGVANGYIVVDADVQNAVELQGAPAYGAQKHFDHVDAKQHILTLSFPDRNAQQFFGEITSLMTALAACGSVGWVAALAGHAPHFVIEYRTFADAAAAQTFDAAWKAIFGDGQNAAPGSTEPTLELQLCAALGISNPEMRYAIDNSTHVWTQKWKSVSDEATYYNSGLYAILGPFMDPSSTADPTDVNNYSAIGSGATQMSQTDVAAYGLAVLTTISTGPAAHPGRKIFPAGTLAKVDNPSMTFLTGQVAQYAAAGMVVNIAADVGVAHPYAIDDFVALPIPVQSTAGLGAPYYYVEWMPFTTQAGMDALNAMFPAVLADTGLAAQVFAALGGSLEYNLVTGVPASGTFPGGTHLIFKFGTIEQYYDYFNGFLNPYMYAALGPVMAGTGPPIALADLPVESFSAIGSKSTEVSAADVRTYVLSAQPLLDWVAATMAGGLVTGYRAITTQTWWDEAPINAKITAINAELAQYGIAQTSFASVSVAAPYEMADVVALPNPLP